MTGAPQTTQQSLFVMRTDFENVHLMLEALAESACLAIEADALPDHFSAGLAELFRRALSEFDELSDKLFSLVMQGSSQSRPNTLNDKKHDPTIWTELMGRVASIVRNVMADAGAHVPEDDFSEWSEAASDQYFSLMANHYNNLMEKLDGVRDPFEAGSLLPWVEMAIRREIGIEPDHISPSWIRDEFILDSIKKGYSTADISQALGLRQKAVERAIGRLTISDADTQKSSAAVG